MADFNSADQAPKMNSGTQDRSSERRWPRILLWCVSGVVIVLLLAVLLLVYGRKGSVAPAMPATAQVAD